MPSVNPYNSIGLGNGLSSGGRAVSPHAEEFGMVVKAMMCVLLVALLVYGFNRLARRNRELSSLRAELQELDQRKREQEKILVNLRMELSRMKDGAVITAKARRLGLRPSTPQQMKYRSQVARRETDMPVAAGRPVADVGQRPALK